MIAVIFEFWVEGGRRQDYFDLAAELRPLLDNADGFISIERFESLSQPGKILSLSFWRDEAAVQAWRNQEAHRECRRRGAPASSRPIGCGSPRSCAITAWMNAPRRPPTPAASTAASA